MTSAPTKDAPINIVGAGIFGLSTALHLARRGYSRVTVFDKQPYDETLYSYLNGCDAASADMNKIIRSAYGSQVQYQELTFEALDAWRAWDAELESGKDLPPGMSAQDRVFHNCGNLSMTDSDTLPDFELATIKTMEACGHRDTQLITTDSQHAKVAKSRGQAFGLDPFRRRQRGKSNLGVFDSTGGVAVADKACRVALHKARKEGARFVFGPTAGLFTSFVNSDTGKIIGITTKDGTQHPAALTIMACGGWTPTLVPQLDGLCETTAGSVIIFKVPQDSDLWNRFAPHNFPTWLWKVRDGAEGGLYGFPRDEYGHVKIGYRGTKYTNPIPQGDGIERSTPITRWSEGAKLTQIPTQAMNVLRGFVDEYIPEFSEQGIDIAFTRVCWYTDSYDNHFVVDHVPDREGLFVATGGSGHAFKYLPNIGNWIVDAIEGLGTDRPALKAWKWRKLATDVTPVNILMEGLKGSRALGNVGLAGERQLKSAGSARL